MFDLIKQSAVTLKRMVCIRICMKGNWASWFEHVKRSFKWSTESDALQLMMENSVVFLQLSGRKQA